MYGENGGQLRVELTTLLRQHRIQHRLGGRGLHTVPERTTVEERKMLGERIRRYRQMVLVWCLQAVRAANPRINLEGSSGRTHGPAEELCRRLAAAVEASDATLPSLEEVTTPQAFAMVETWRLAARAAALGEHDFGAGVGYGRLSNDQCMTVLKDAAEITRALVGLDRRYANIPDWQSLKDRGRLGRAAEACASFAGYDDPDYSVDLRGWRPPANLDQGPRRSGIPGILQGEYNLLVELKRFPDAHSMRLVLDSQRIVSHETAIRARSTDPELADKWEGRSRTYKAVIDETRNIRGRLGNGGPAAGQAAIVAARAQKLARDGAPDPKSLRRLDRLFTRIDARLTDVLAHGVAQRLYFLRVKLPRVVDQAGGLVQRARTRYVPIDSPVQTDLLQIVRSQLRPPPGRLRAPNGAARSRAEFEAAITHLPERRGSVGL
jgi:hypothetical protein